LTTTLVLAVGGFIRQFLFAGVCFLLLLAATGFNVFFHSPAALPGFLSLLAAGIQPGSHLIKHALLLHNDLVKLSNKSLPGLQAGHLHDTVLAGTDLVTVFLLVALQILNLLTLGLVGLLRLSHFLQRLVLFLLFQLENDLQSFRS
jgi:hypothetical protein